MINLGRSTAEYESEKIKILFEQPTNFNEIISDDKWLLIGRKGSGKSSYIDYRISENTKVDQDIIRPGRRLSNAVLSIYTRIATKFNGTDNPAMEDEVKEHISIVLDFLIHTAVMKKIIEPLQNNILSGSEKVAYNFLKNNDLIGGSTLYKSIKFLRKISQGLSQIEMISSNLENLESETFDDAVENLYKMLREKNKFFILFIDNIDDYGFDYTVRNRAFYNALLTSVMRINDNSLVEKIPFRVFLAIPSELYETSVLWNRDKVEKRIVYLHWEDVRKVKNLVNKRIAIELNVKKKNPRWEGDKYSISDINTWDKYFHKEILNKKHIKEDLFIYILRHSLYTPRTVLDICSAILNTKSDSGISDNDMLCLSTKEESDLVVAVIEGQTLEISRSIINIYQKMYFGFPALIQIFKGRPNCWEKVDLESFLLEEAQNIVKEAATNNYVNDTKSIINLLYKSGVIGFGENTHTAPQHCEQYGLSFSYVKKQVLNERWDIAVISPIFYDFMGIKREPAINVEPHNKLTLTPSSVRKLHNYNIKLNYAE